MNVNRIWWAAVIASVGLLAFQLFRPAAWGQETTPNVSYASPYSVGVYVAKEGQPPLPTFTPTPQATPVPASLIYGYVTHYGESYNGQTMGCGGTYWSSDPYIVAVSPARYSEWPCGTILRITGAAGQLDIPRTDSCPGCGPNLLDLSEAGSEVVCGFVGNCPVTIEVIR